MNSTLVAVYIGILCAAMLVLLVWLIVQLVRQFKGKGAENAVIKLDGSYYELKPIGEDSPPAASVVPERAPDDDGEDEEEDDDDDDDEDGEREEPQPAGQPAGVLVEPGAVVLKRAKSVSYAEAYAALSSEQRGYAGDILAYAKEKEEARELVTDRGASVLFGKRPLVRIFIRRGTVVARMTVPNNELAEYADNNNLNIKEKPIDLKIMSAANVGTAKDIVDLTYRNLLEERRRRQEAKKERRRQARLAAKQAAMAENKEKGGTE